MHCTPVADGRWVNLEDRSTIGAGKEGIRESERSTVQGNPAQSLWSYRFLVVMLIPKLSIIMNDVSRFRFVVMASM